MSTSPAPRSAVVTVAHGQHDELAVLHRSLSVADDLPRLMVVVAVDDADLITWNPARGVPVDVVPMSGTPAGLPWAAARNAGATVALAAGADALVFLDVTCLAGDQLVAALATSAIGEPDTLWCGLSQPLDPPPEGGYDLTAVIDEAPTPSSGADPARPDSLRPEDFQPAAVALSREAWGRLGGFPEESGDADRDVPGLARAAEHLGLRLGVAPGAHVWVQHTGPTSHG